MSDAVRDAFEKWFEAPVPLKRNGDGYAYGAAQSSWIVWKSAYDSMLDEAIKRLNSMLACDVDAITSLVQMRILCNERLAEHPTCQVVPVAIGRVVGMLGVLNGCFGVNESGNGLIGAQVSDGVVISFVRNQETANVV